MALARSTTAVTVLSTLSSSPGALLQPFLPSVSSTLLLPRAGLRQELIRSARVVAQGSSYGMPSYGAPRPYQTPGADFHNGTRPAGGGSGTNPYPRRLDLQWHYGAPADYSAPVSYQTPKTYGAPQAYGPGAELGDPGASFDEVQKQAAELDAGGNGGRGDGDSGNSGDGGGRGDDDGGDADDAKKKLAGLSMSQKLTLAYAILVAVGGVVGLVKSGSSASVLAGGGAASILYYVFLSLPTKPIMSSIIGLGISGLLLFVMGSRYSESGKLFPAGVVSLYSLVMAGGYIHGIMRGH